MKKLVALSLVIALSFLVLAPMPVEAGAEGRANTALGLAIGGLALSVWNAARDYNQPQVVYPQPSYPVYSSQPVYAPAPMVMYRSPICVGQLTVEYGWRQHPSGNGVEYVPTGRSFCNGQILY